MDSQEDTIGDWGFEQEDEEAMLGEDVLVSLELFIKKCVHDLSLADAQSSARTPKKKAVANRTSGYVQSGSRDSPIKVKGGKRKETVIKK